MKLSKQIKEELQSYLKDRLSKREVRTQIIAPYELSQEEVEKIKSKIPLIRNSTVDVMVDESVLAGVVIKHGSKLIDYSLKSKVESLFGGN
jgi:F0F1-type ATP synthase delta subunit